AARAPQLLVRFLTLAEHRRSGKPLSCDRSFLDGELPRWTLQRRTKQSGSIGLKFQRSGFGNELEVYLICSYVPRTKKHRMFAYYDFMPDTGSRCGVGRFRGGARRNPAPSGG